MAVEVKEKQPSDVETEQLATGCEAIAEAIRLADVDVMAAYPIRPYDGVMQAAAKLIANGKMDVEYIVADGEHSQFEIVKHACAVGSRVFVGSSGVGWFYAFEAIAVTAGLRLPVVAICGNRALDDPGAFGTEHNDSLAVRDLGWVVAVGRDGARGARSRTHGVARRGGQARVAPDRDRTRRRLPHPLAAHREDPDTGRGGQVPAEIRSGRPSPPPGEPERDRAAGRPGLSDGDPPPERRGDAERARRDPRGAR